MDSKAPKSLDNGKKLRICHYINGYFQTVNSYFLLEVGNKTAFICTKYSRIFSYFFLLRFDFYTL